MKNTNHIHQENLSTPEKFALWITNKIGTMGFFGLIFFWTISWLSWNTLAPDTLKFDPFPGFVLWLFMSNVLQIFLMPLLMIGQNLQSKHAEIRSENDFEVNIQAEQQTEEILLVLKRLEQRVIALEQKLDSK